MNTPIQLRLTVDDVMTPQPWPIVLEADGSTIVSGRPDARAILEWQSLSSAITSDEPQVGFTPVFASLVGPPFTVPGQYLAAAPTPFTGDLAPLREMEAKYREALDPS
jgi:hypothetical protein